MTTSKQRLMKESEIPAFVEDVIATGCDICAVGHVGYVLGDVEEMKLAEVELRRINLKYGDRDFLRYQIIGHLRSLGRYLDLESDITHWSENLRPKH